MPRQHPSVRAQTLDAGARALPIDAGKTLTRSNSVRQSASTKTNKAKERVNTPFAFADAVIRASLKDAVKVSVADAMADTGAVVGAVVTAGVATAADFLAGAVLKLIVASVSKTNDKLDRLLGSSFKAGIAEAERALQVTCFSGGDETVRAQLVQNANSLLALALEQKPEHAILILTVRSLLAYHLGALGFASSFCIEARKLVSEAGPGYRTWNIGVSRTEAIEQSPTIQVRYRSAWGLL